MSDRYLLPSNATPQEVALSAAVARISDVPVPVRDILDADNCPAALLPWLAWSFSVDEWNSAWTDDEKRAVIRNSVYVHKHKGTLAALKRAVEPLGYVIRIIEWYEDVPVAAPYTFRIEVSVQDRGIDSSVYDQMLVLIQTYKNVRSQMTSLKVKGEVPGSMYLSAGLMSGSITEVYPYTPSDLTSTALLYFGAAEQSFDTVAVYPAS